MPNLSPFYPALLAFVGALLVAAGGFWASWRQSNFNAEIREKNAEIALLQQESANTITGGSSYCWTAFQVFASNGSAVNAYSMPDDLLLIPNFIAVGSYPLYDVAALMVDLDILQTDVQRASTTVSVGNMTPGFAITTSTQLRHHGKDFNFNIFYIARNGAWTQMLRMRWVGDGWAMANKVMRGSKEIHREVSPNFPPPDQGTNEWGEAVDQGTR
jgi:hypothetical protein